MNKFHVLTSPGASFSLSGRLAAFLCHVINVFAFMRVTCSRPLGGVAARLILALWTVAAVTSDEEEVARFAG